MGKLSVSDLEKYMSHEALNETSYLKRIHNSDPEEAIYTGDVLGPLKPCGTENRSMVLRGEGIYYSRYRPGERIKIAIVNPRTGKFRTLRDSSVLAVRYPAPKTVEVLVPRTEVLLDKDSEFFLLPSGAVNIKWTLRKRLQDLSDSGEKAEYTNIDFNKVKKHFSHEKDTLNKKQQEAIQFLIENDLKGLVQGPPGTGKTKLLVNLMRIAIESQLRVGLVSLTHAAVDNALGKLIDSGVDLEKVSRITSDINKIRTEQYRNIDVAKIWGGSFKKESQHMTFEGKSSPQVYAATLHTWALSNDTPEIDILIIDEASQVPIYFYPFLEAMSSRVIMFGDHKQLPPVLQGSTRNLPAEDIFSFEINSNQYPMLEIQYRMNEGVQEWSSTRFYEGKLTPDESVRDRDVLSGLGVNSQLIGNRTVTIHKHSGSSSNNCNPIEASKVADLVYALSTYGSIRLKDIGIVTPYRTQAGLINAKLQDKFGVDKCRYLVVDTVERFQGQEREAMVMSMGVEKDLSRKGDRGFLGDGRRLNVGVTRAKSRFYCLASEKLIESTEKQKNADHLNSFFSWCQAGSQAEGEEVG